MSALFKTPKIDYGSAMSSNNDEMMKMMQAQNEKNNALQQQHQANIMDMESQRIEMEQAMASNIQREEKELLAKAQAMEDAAQEESVAMAYDDGPEGDIDNVVTGFYGSLLKGQRPE